MAQLRLALAQVNPTVGDLAGNAELVRRLDRARPPSAGAHLVAFPEMVLTGYPVEDLVLRTSFVDASRARADAARRRPRRRRARRPAVVVGYLDRATARRRRQRRSPAGCCPQNCAARAAPRAGRRPLRQAPPAQLRRLRRVPRTSCPATPDRGPGRAASTWRSPSARTSGRRRAGRRWPRAAGAGLLLVASTARRTSWTRTTSGCALVRAPGRRGRVRRWPTSTWSAARTSWSSTATRSSSTRTASVLARGPQFAEDLLVLDLDLPAEPTADAPPTTRRRDADRASRSVATSRPPPYAAASRRPMRRAARPTRPRCTQALVLGLRDYVRKNGFRSVVLGLSGGIDSALVAAIAGRRARRRTNVVGVSMPSQLLLASTPATTPPTWPSGPGWTTGSSRSSRWSTRSWPTSTLSGSRGEPAGPGARRRS